MSNLTLSDERPFEQDFRVLGATGLAAGLVASLLVAIAGGHQSELMALSFGGVFGVAASFLPGGEERPILSAIGALLGAVIFAAAIPTQLAAAGVAGSLFGLVLSLGEPVRSRVGAAVAGAAGLAAAAFTTSTLLGPTSALAEMPVLFELATGAVWATFLGAGMGVRHLRWSEDSVTRQLEEAAEETGGYEAEQLRAALELYEPVRRVFAELEEDRLRRNAQTITEEVVRALVRFSERAAELRAATGGRRRDAMERNIESIESRIDSTDRDAVEEELEAAKRDLLREAEVRERIETAIARLEVRQHRCLTALERLHMNLVERRGAGGAEMRLEASIEELDELTDEMEWRNLSVDAICAPRAGATGVDLLDEHGKLDDLRDPDDAARRDASEGSTDEADSTGTEADDEAKQQTRRAAHAFDGE